MNNIRNHQATQPPLAQHPTMPLSSSFTSPLKPQPKTEHACAYLSAPGAGPSSPSPSLKQPLTPAAAAAVTPPSARQPLDDTIRVVVRFKGGEQLDEDGGGGGEQVRAREASRSKRWLIEDRGKEI